MGPDPLPPKWKKNKHGLHWTQKLGQLTNWKVNLWICKLAKASNIESWSVQQFFLAELFSLIHLADFSCSLYSYCTMPIITCKVGMYQSAHVEKCMCCKVQTIRWQAIHIASYILHLTHFINFLNLNLRMLWQFLNHRSKNLLTLYLRNLWKLDIENLK